MTRAVRQSGDRTPAISVIMPAFNAERYVVDALASIAAQTRRDVEVIVVDDGSTDGTIREVERFGDRLDLTVLHQRNAGPSAARNAGIRRARGRYCAFLDADDAMLPELLELQAAALDADPRVGMVVADITTFDERGTIRERHWDFSGTRETALDRLVVENYVTTSAVMVPTERLLEAGLFPEDRRVAEDYELWLKIAARWDVAFVERPLVRYRYTSGSLSSDKLNSSRCALEVIEAFWRDHQEYRTLHAPVAHRSLARHLANAGGAACLQRERVAAFVYLLRSLRHDAGARDTWKWLAKLLYMRPKGSAAHV
jgi:cellulose synthase/poly-beta-1,6-N-acetylglucosamine synthase-like glycosyltransferase